MFEGTVASTLKKASPHALSTGHWHYDEIVRLINISKSKLDALMSAGLL
jgi:hypothetical protein